MQQEYNFYVYIMASKSWVLYIGVTNNLQRRVQEHREWKIEWFTKKYNSTRLVYFEHMKYVYNAISRKKVLKHFLRKQKEELIESLNPGWKDLFLDL
jgi:putative endonuclease